MTDWDSPTQWPAASCNTDYPAFLWYLLTPGRTKITYNIQQNEVLIVRVSITVSSSSRQLPPELTSSATYKRKAARQRRTNILLTCVSLVFFLAWAPIHLFLVIMDTIEPLKEDEETVLMIYACCHLTAMTTVCVNPLLYGWCNTNFKGVITTTSTTARSIQGSVIKLNAKRCDGCIDTT